MGRIDEIQGRCDAATPGKWAVKTERADYVAVQRSGTPICAMSSLNCAYTNQRNAAFIAHAREDIPYLLAEVKQLTDGLDKAQRATDSVGSGYDYYANRAQRWENAAKEWAARAEKAERERDTYKAALQNWHEREESV